MTSEADQPDGIKPWTIKGIPAEERNAAIAAAKRGKMSIGDWLSRAIRVAVQADRQDQRAPAVVADQSDRTGERSDPADLAEVERLVDMVGKLAIATGEPPPEGVSKTAYRLLRRRLTAAGVGQTK